MDQNVTREALLVSIMYFTDDENAMDQDSSDNSSDDLLSDSGLAEEDIVPAVEKYSLSVPSEVSIEKDVMCTT
jgi:hypothetical protein